MKIQHSILRHVIIASLTIYIKDHTQVEAKGYGNDIILNVLSEKYRCKAFGRKRPLRTTQSIPITTSDTTLTNTTTTSATTGAIAVSNQSSNFRYYENNVLTSLDQPSFQSN